MNQTEGERLRDEGHAKVIKHDRSWHEQAMSILRTSKHFAWARGDITSEDIKFALKAVHPSLAPPRPS